jgi:hypothetical protein
MFLSNVQAFSDVFSYFQPRETSPSSLPHLSRYVPYTNKTFISQNNDAKQKGVTHPSIHLCTPNEQI